jgi:hypothetical protein
MKSQSPTTSPRSESRSPNQVTLIGWLLTFAGLLLAMAAIIAAMPKPPIPALSSTADLCFLRNGRILENGYQIQGPDPRLLPVVYGRVGVKRLWEGATMRLLDKDGVTVIHTWVLKLGNESPAEIVVPPMQASPPSPR